MLKRLKWCPESASSGVQANKTGSKSIWILPVIKSPKSTEGTEAFCIHQFPGWEEGCVRYRRDQVGMIRMSRVSLGPWGAFCQAHLKNAAVPQEPLEWARLLSQNQSGDGNAKTSVEMEPGHSPSFTLLFSRQNCPCDASVLSLNSDDPCFVPAQNSP